MDGDGLVVVAGFQGDAVDVGLGGEEEEGLGDDADCAVADQFQPHGAGADGAFGRWAVQAQVAAAIVVVGAGVRTCQVNGNQSSFLLALLLRQFVLHFFPTFFLHSWLCFTRTKMYMRHY